MKKFQFLRNIAGTSFAFLAFVVAQSAASQVCIIFHQEKIPKKVESLKNRKK